MRRDIGDAAGAGDRRRAATAARALLVSAVIALGGAAGAPAARGQDPMQQVAQALDAGDTSAACAAFEAVLGGAAMADRGRLGLPMAERIAAAGHADAVLAVLDRRIAAAASDPFLRWLRGAFRAKLKQLDGARADFEAAIAADPQSLELKARLAQLSELAFDLERAARLYAVAGDEVSRRRVEALLGDLDAAALRQRIALGAVLAAALLALVLLRGRRRRDPRVTGS